MFDQVIAYSVKNKLVIGLLVVALIIWGGFSLSKLPIDAVPDITNNQVQVITISPTLATQEIEQFITTPVELALQNLQQKEEIRSISRFGLSVVTIVFAEGYDLYLARQLVNEKLKEAQEAIPEGLGTPEMAPISTGLGEVYQYIVRPKKGYEEQYSLTDLRSIQDWIVKRQLAGIEGVAEVNTMGGYLKQYEVAIRPDVLKSLGMGIKDVFEALTNSNENTGGAYIEKTPYAYYIRSEGIARSLADIGQIVITNRNNVPVLVKDVAKIQFGKAPRYGALVRNGKEAVGGRVMMFKGANSAEVTQKVKERVVQIQKSLPQGVMMEPYLVRDKLIKATMGTVKKNLLEGGLIVVFILVLMLGNLRAGLIVVSVIPLAMLFAVSMMYVLGISANLMSLGAIDFGLIVDGAIIIVEAIVHRRQSSFAHEKLNQQQMDREVRQAAQKIRSSAAFGEIIILIVYIPIIALAGIEGKMFRPMAQTVILAILGALILSLTYVPMMSALFLNKKVVGKKNQADYITSFFQGLYKPFLQIALRLKVLILSIAIGAFVVSLLVFERMGGEFIPTLEEGDLAMQHILPSGSSLLQSINVAKTIQKKLLDQFPEIKDIVVNIGAAEIPTDPMPVEIGDYTLVMHPKSTWTSADSREELFEKMEHFLQNIPGVGYEFSQPIQLRFNELMTGTKADIAIRLYGDNLEVLADKAKETEKIVANIEGVSTVNAEQVTGMPQIIIRYNYAKMAQYGLQVKEVNQVVEASFAGAKAGVIYEGEKRFDLVVRLDKAYRKNIDDVRNTYITLPDKSQVSLASVTDIQLIKAPMQISREDTRRRIVIGVNTGATDVETLVRKIQSALDTSIALPPGYYYTYGGQFENLKAAKKRLVVAVPMALALIFMLLYFTFGSVSQAALIFTTIPLAAIGGVWALKLRAMPFSISAGIGFIALFGVAVLNGIVLIGYFNQLKKEGEADIKTRITKGAMVRLRPVLMTAAVASLGFLPMALSTSGGAEVQRPLATVVIGGLISATFLTLIVLPILYSWLAKWQETQKGGWKIPKFTLVLLPGFLLFIKSHQVDAQSLQTPIGLDSAINLALENHPAMKANDLTIQKNKVMQNMPYNPGLTVVNYQGDGLFGFNSQRVNQLNVVQNFANPGITKAQNRLQNALLTQGLITRKTVSAQLKWQVKQLYLDIQYQKKLLTIYSELIITYEKYKEKAKARHKTGETNQVEMLSIQLQLNKYQLLKRQVILKNRNLEQRFSNLINARQLFTTRDSLRLLTHLPARPEANLLLKQARQNIQIEQDRVYLVKSQARLGFSLGYAAQNFDEGGWLSGLQAGIQIPLFNGQNRRKVQAQKIQVEMAKVQYQNTELNVKQQLLETQAAIQLYAEGARFYQSQIRSVSSEMVRVATLSYQTGQASYLELLNTLNLSAQNKKSYWEQVFGYNKAIIFYQFLSNQ